jgi:ribonuclease VapC
VPGRPIVLDSWAVIAYFEDQPGAAHVEEILAEARLTAGRLAMSVVNVGEVWHSLARSYSAAVADAKIEELASLGIEFINATWEVTRQAAAYKARGSIAYADCFAAALSKLLRAELVTGDKEYRLVEGEVNIIWL